MIFPWWRITYAASDGASIDTKLCLDELAERGVSACEVTADKLVLCYVEGAAPSRTDCEALIAGLSLSFVSVVPVEEQNWVSKCEQILTPVECGRIRIIPLVDDRTPEHSEERDLLLRPGMGFGTGHHSTTRTILQRLSDLADDTSIAPPNSILDIGTGSGVLAIAAWKLWGVPVLALDVDQDALANARENCEMNGAAKQIYVSDEPVENVSASFDLIFANLYLEILVSYESEFRRLCAPDGRLIVSGVMSMQFPALHAHYSRAGWRAGTPQESEGWVACEYFPE